MRCIIIQNCMMGVFMGSCFCWAPLEHLVKCSAYMRVCKWNTVYMIDIDIDIYICDTRNVSVYLSIHLYIISGSMSFASGDTRAKYQYFPFSVFSVLSGMGNRFCGSENFEFSLCSNCQERRPSRL